MAQRSHAADRYNLLRAISGLITGCDGGRRSRIDGDERQRLGRAAVAEQPRRHGETGEWIEYRLDDHDTVAAATFAKLLRQVSVADQFRAPVDSNLVGSDKTLSLDRAIELTLACCKGYRMPEPTRLAHLAAAGRIAPREPRESLDIQQASQTLL